MEKHRFISLGLITLLLCAVIIAVLSSKSSTNSELTISLTFIVNIIYAFLMSIHTIKKKPYSFQLMFWLFNLMFFGVAPCLQYSVNKFSWNLVPTEDELLSNNIIIFVWMSMFFIGTKCKKGIMVRNKVFFSTEPRDEKYQLTNKWPFLAIVSVIIILYKIRTIGLSNMFLMSVNTNDELNQTASLLFGRIMNGFLLFSTTYVVISLKKGGHLDVFKIIIVCSFLLGCFPTGLSRNMMAAYYGGILLICLPWHEDNYLLTFAIIFGLIVVWPAMNVVRNLRSFDEASDIIQNMKEQIANTYLTGDYDAYQMLITVRRYVSQYDITYGYQLLGCILFFVPRTIWNSKPIGTGAMTITMLNQNSFTNVSAPLVSEAYVNFGMVGIIFVGFVLGYYFSKADERYWNTDCQESLIRVIYPFMTLMFFFMERGDLLSSGAYTIAILAVGIVMHKFVVTSSDDDEACDDEIAEQQ